MHISVGFVYGTKKSMQTDWNEWKINPTYTQ